MCVLCLQKAVLQSSNNGTFKGDGYVRYICFVCHNFIYLIWIDDIFLLELAKDGLHLYL